MRILISAVGSRGDVVPFTGIGAALRKAGHTVTIAAHPSYAPLVTGAGLQAHGMPGDLGSCWTSRRSRHRPTRQVGCPG